MPDSCATCRFFRDSGENSHPDEIEGDCRIRSPKIIGVISLAKQRHIDWSICDDDEIETPEQLEPIEPFDWLVNQGRWPIVRGKDWCGEYQAISPTGVAP